MKRFFSLAAVNDDDFWTLDVLRSFNYSITSLIQNSRSILLYFITISFGMNFDFCQWMGVQPPQ
jgi:hypothetical protein